MRFEGDLDLLKAPLEAVTGMGRGKGGDRTSSRSWR